MWPQYITQYISSRIKLAYEHQTQPYFGALYHLFCLQQKQQNILETIKIDFLKHISDVAYN